MSSVNKQTKTAPAIDAMVPLKEIMYSILRFNVRNFVSILKAWQEPRINHMPRHTCFIKKGGTNSGFDFLQISELRYADGIDANEW